MGLYIFQLKCGEVLSIASGDFRFSHFKSPIEMCDAAHPLQLIPMAVSRQMTVKNLFI